MMFRLSGHEIHSHSSRKSTSSWRAWMSTTPSPPRGLVTIDMGVGDLARHVELSRAPEVCFFPHSFLPSHSPACLSPICKTNAPHSRFNAPTAQSSFVGLLNDATLHPQHDYLNETHGRPIPHRTQHDHHAQRNDVCIATIRDRWRRREADNGAGTMYQA
ncbi:hypothetical protein Hypma_000407 [Hypsizygus marmoreus]|uniref:Uncharacterized protein n=1 Tax=Hypsizygus marmoreus TaxID=39966 RepID=A0A369JAQ5_HYPMA|nr:hypothetical protein Hypma_000407 [Hypsizygus marmoreus]